MQEDTSQPASILHVYRLVQSQHPLERFTVYVGAHVLLLTRQRIHCIAGDEAHRQEYQYRQQQESGYQEQNAADEVRINRLPDTYTSGRWRK